MRLYFIKTPKWIISFYKKYIWRFLTNKKEIYLTFDDGPTPKITEFVLDTLEKYNAKATFFCVGKNIEDNPILFNRIIKDGHTIANHTQNHLNGWKTNSIDYVKNVEECQELLISNSKLFRPPYGKIKTSQAKKLIKKGYKIIMWSVLSADFDSTITKEKCYTNVIKNTKKGDTVVFHDSQKAFNNLKYALPRVLDYFTTKGFSFKKIIVISNPQKVTFTT